MTIRKSRYGKRCLVGLLLALAAPWAFPNDLGRDDEAVVLPGNAAPSLAGIAPDRLAAFRWEGRWTRVPVQVDERAVVDFATIYGDSTPSGHTVLTYTDAGTFTGPDPDPSLDFDDEIVFQVKEAGNRAPAGAGLPAGVIPESGVELTLAHPTTGAAAWLYLFRGDGTLPVLPPSVDVVYDFALLSGDYKSTYDTGGVGDLGNPEASTVTTPSYRVGFSDRWMRVDTGVLRDGAPGTDILERHRDRFGPDVCSRTEWTFSRGEGAFIVNKNGPVRALRAYVGANSGITTYRIHAYYPSTEVIRTVLRVHSIPGLIDFFDWDATAAGMTWRNDLNPQGVPVDGVPDVVATGPFLWESLSGPQGSIALVPILDTDIPGFTWTSWYADSIPATAAPCPDQGDDDRQYGASGFWRSGGVANTDPAMPGDVYHLALTRTLRYLAPNAPATAGPDLRDEIGRPVVVAFSAYLPSSTCADLDGDRWFLCAAGCEPADGASCGDCDDGDAGVHPGATETCDRRDEDCDGFVDEDLPQTVWYRDSDGDGWGDPADGEVSCEPSAPVGRVARAGDCDDADPGRNPDAAEVCDGLDQDCDGAADDGLSFDTWYRDRDGDGYGDPGDTAATCDGMPPSGYVGSDGDCDDADNARNPAAAESCNERDDDCDGAVDEDLVFSTWYRDADGDGYGTDSTTTSTCLDAPPEGYAVRNGDCDDADSSRNPAATEICDGVDQDCDGLADNGLVFETGYRDRDGDGYGDASATVSTCAGSLPAGYAGSPGDCDDSRGDISPGASESCNGIDDDCDGAVDEDLTGCGTIACQDGDGDEWAVCGDGCSPAPGILCGDCDDGDPLRHPGATEACNGRDDDCDGVPDDGLTFATWYRDDDLDGFGLPTEPVDTCDGPPPGHVANGGDCDDGDPLRHPGATEVCNGRDDDCDGAVDDGLPRTTWFADSDGDGVGRNSATETTCDPGAPDGYAAEGGDCDDGDAGVHPGATESCDGVDNDCSPGTDDGSSEPWIGEPCDGEDADSCSSGSAICSAGTRRCDDDPFSSVDVCDGIDNDCDAVADNPACVAFDVDGNGRVDGLELAWVARAFGSCRVGAEAPWWGPVDFDGDGCIDGSDLVVLANLWARTCVDGTFCR